MAPHSSTLAWKIPWMEKPGRLQSMGWLRVGHDWATSLSLFTFAHRRRKWQPTPVFLPGESQGQRSLVGCCLWGRTESDTRLKQLSSSRQRIKKQRHYFADKGLSDQSYCFSSSHVWMWELDYKEGWALKNSCFWTVVLEKTLESPLDCKEIKPVNPKRNQSWIFIGRTDAEAETPTLWPPDAKNWLSGKDPGAGKDWRQKKGMTKDEMVGWHHQLNGHEFKQVPGVSDGQGSLVSCSPWDHKESDMTEQLNWNDAAM